MPSLTAFEDSVTRLAEVQEHIAQLEDLRYGDEHSRWLLEQRIYEAPYSYNSYHPLIRYPSYMYDDCSYRSRFDSYYFRTRGTYCRRTDSGRGYYRTMDAYYAHMPRDYWRSDYADYRRCHSQSGCRCHYQRSCC